MGIINVTPDSFYERSRKKTIKEILEIAERMLLEGADFLDLGGYSSRPGAKDIEEQEELDRVIAPIYHIKKAFPQAIVSIDTFRARVAEKAVDHGAEMVNDISGGHLDKNMLKIVARLNVPYIATHLKGNPQVMKQMSTYDDMIKEIMLYFSIINHRCQQLGIKDLIIDPGFGFAKTVEQNFILLNSMAYFQWLALPILVGLSRKSMIYKTLNVNAEGALNGTTSLNTLALCKGTSILRVHDIKEAVEVIKLTEKLT